MFHRKPSFAGSFYPGDKNTLNATIEKLFEDTEIDKSSDIAGIISPHAGYVYSGPVAAYSYKAVAGKDYDCVIALAPSHRARFEGYSVITEGVYETPFGNVEIDSIIGKKLQKKKHASFFHDIEVVEHSLEVQVPFLQYALKKFTLVPIIVGTVDLPTCKTIAEEIYDCIKDETRKILVVMSTDLSHYHSYDVAREMDLKLAEMLVSFDADKVNDILESDEAEACGEGPILTGMMLLKKMKAASVKILKYANSGDTSGDKSRVVGYLSASFVR